MQNPPSGQIRETQLLVDSYARLEPRISRENIGRQLTAVGKTGRQLSAVADVIYLCSVEAVLALENKLETESQVQIV